MSHALAESVQELRGAAMRGLVQAVYDTGQMQTVDVITHDGMVRAGIEVYQPYGFATSAPVVGSVVQLAAIGGDPGDLIALPPITPAARYGNLAQGEVVVYDVAGQRVALRQGGAIDIKAATIVNIDVPNVAINAPLGVAITGPVTIIGSLNVTGDVVAGSGGPDISLLTHVHGGVMTGGGDTGQPA
jgi:phage gp45-like